MRSADWSELDKEKFLYNGTALFTGIRVVGHPLGVLRVHVQAGSEYKTGWSAFKGILKTEGPLQLYRGFWISSVSLIFRQVYFSIYEFSKYHLGAKGYLNQRFGTKLPDFVREFIGGSLASLAFQPLLSPADVISQRMIIHMKTGKIKFGDSLSMARQVYSESGVRGFFKGLPAALIQVAPSSGVFWSSYATFLSLFPADWGFYSIVPAATLSAIATSIITNPLDVVRTRLQVSKNTGDKFMPTMRGLFKQQGFIGSFGLGLGPRMVSFVPMSIMILCIYEVVKSSSIKV